MSEKKSAYDNILETDFKTEVERLKYQAEVMWKKELDYFKLLGISDDMRILEVGSGPGYMTELIKKSYPNNSMTCLELNPELISVAKNTEYLKEFKDITYIQGSILESNLPSQSFDIIFTSLVLMHISEREKAVEEIYRLLKPGGISIIIEADQDLTIMEPDVDKEHLYLKEKGKEIDKKFGVDNKFGRRLPKLLLKFGFLQTKMNGIVIHSDIDTFFFREMSSPKYAKPFLDKGLITTEEYNYLLKYNTELLENEDAIGFVVVFIIISIK